MNETFSNGMESNYLELHRNIFFQTYVYYCCIIKLFHFSECLLVIVLTGFFF